MKYVNDYLIIEIADKDVWVPIIDARTDVTTKKQVNLFLTPDACETIELTKIPNPMACWIVAKSKSFLMMWLIFNLNKMNAHEAMADMITTVPSKIGIKKIPFIFALNFSPVSKQLNTSSTIAKQKSTGLCLVFARVSDMIRSLGYSWIRN